MKKLELLAPAGSLDICKAVIDAGADAVYLGGNLFGARAYAKNFDEEQLYEALDYAHLFDRKIFLTVNTLLKNNEIEKYLYDYIEPLYRHGLDAAIVQDFGVLKFLHREFPDLPLHASTQMSITNSYGASWLKEQGVSRVVTAREVSLGEIQDIYQQTQMEIESFVHGALCYSYSGQCLLSSLLGGRSGNRGRCAQPCRLAYDVIDDKQRKYNKNQEYPLSPKDLCTIDLLPDMAKAGVYSYKIEGRMKQLEYAVGVTSIYRKYMDFYMSNPSEYKVNKRDKEQLLLLGNRNGFTQGYYYQRNDKSLLSLSTSAHKSGEAKEILPLNPLKLPVVMEAEFITGSPCRLTISDEKYQVTVQGEIVQMAMKQPLRKEDLQDRLSKTGDTVFSVSDFRVNVSDDAFLPVKFINELRRNALESLRQKHLEASYRKEPLSQDYMHQKCAKADADSIKEAEPTISVLVRSKEQLQAVLKNEFVDMVYIDSYLGAHIEDLTDLVAQIKDAGKKAVYAFPHVLRKNSVDFILKYKQEIKECQFDGLLVRTHDGVGFAKEVFPELSIIADHGLYTYSDVASKAFADEKITINTIPFELNEKEIKHRNNTQSELIVYGWIPVMYTAQCIYKNFESCHKNVGSDRVLYLKDRYAKNFPVLCDCLHCNNTIFNTQPLYLFGQSAKLVGLRVKGYRLEFLFEDEKEVLSLLKECKETILEGKKADMTKWENRFTNGHFKRGIE